MAPENVRLQSVVLLVNFMVRFLCLEIFRNTAFPGITMGKSTNLLTSGRVVFGGRHEECFGLTGGCGHLALAGTRLDVCVRMNVDVCAVGNYCCHIRAPHPLYS